MWLNLNSFSRCVYRKHRPRSGLKVASIRFDLIPLYRNLKILLLKIKYPYLLDTSVSKSQDIVVEDRKSPSS